MEHVKQSVTVLGVPGGAPIMGSDHLAIQALFKTQTAVYTLDFAYKLSLYVIDCQCSHRVCR